MGEQNSANGAVHQSQVTWGWGGGGVSTVELYTLDALFTMVYSTEIHGTTEKLK